VVIEHNLYNKKILIIIMETIFWTLLIVITFIILFFVYNLTYLWRKPTMEEKWQNYMEAPFDYMETGSNPLNFYRKDQYRKPYRWPFKFYQSYPLPAMQPYALL